MPKIANPYDPPAINAGYRANRYSPISMLLPKKELINQATQTPTDEQSNARRIEHAGLRRFWCQITRTQP